MCFPFSALAGDVVTIQIQPESGLDVYLEVYDDDTDEAFAAYETDLTTGFEEVVFTAPSAGNYYFQVLIHESSDVSAGDYDANVLGPTSALIVLDTGDKVEGRFDDDGFIEYWLRGDLGDTVTLSAESGDDVDLVLEVLDLDDNVLAIVDDGISGANESLTYTYDSVDWIVVRISDFYGEPGKFSLAVDAS